MTKLLYIVMSGEEAEHRFDSALGSAIRIVENKMVDELKVLFYGRSELLVAKASGDRAERIKKLIEYKVVDSACIAIARNLAIETELETRGVALDRYSSRLTTLLKEGYTPISF